MQTSTAWSKKTIIASVTFFATLALAAYQLSALQGSVVTIGNRDQALVHQVTFEPWEDFEMLEGGAEGNAPVYMILTPHSSSMSRGATLCQAFNDAQDLYDWSAYYGYVYSSKSADAERDAAERQIAGEATPFRDAFPGRFFVSSFLRSSSNFTQQFEAQRGVEFLNACDISLEGDMRIAVILWSTRLPFKVRGLVTCGDNVVGEGEACDDSNRDNGDGCSSSCVVEDGWDCQQISARGGSVCTVLCGDGRCSIGEACDDGNRNDGDFCSSSCVVEAQCGNGIRTNNESCDDGNTDDGDGCSSSCNTEFGWICEDTYRPGLNVCQGHTPPYFNACRSTGMEEITRWE